MAHEIINRAENLDLDQKSNVPPRENLSASFEQKNMLRVALGIDQEVVIKDQDQDERDIKLQQQISKIFELRAEDMRITSVFFLITNCYF